MLSQAGSGAFEGLVVELDVVQCRLAPAPVLLHHLRHQRTPHLPLAEPGRQRPAGQI